MGDTWAQIWVVLCSTRYCVSLFPLLGVIRPFETDLNPHYSAFITQVLGAGMASSNTATHDQIMRGIHIYMGGVG